MCWGGGSWLGTGRVLAAPPTSHWAESLSLMLQVVSHTPSSLRGWGALPAREELLLVAASSPVTLEVRLEKDVML